MQGFQICKYQMANGQTRSDSELINGNNLFFFWITIIEKAKWEAGQKRTAVWDP